MERTTIPPRKYLVIPAMGLAAYGSQHGAAQSTLAMGLMIAFAAMIQMTAMTLRDAAFRALTSNHALNARDVLAYACSLVFDAVVLFGLITGAGLLLSWSSFTFIAAIISLAMPLLAIFLCRSFYNPPKARSGMTEDRWGPPAMLALAAGFLLLTQSFQVSGGSQPYVWLVLLSTLLVPNKSVTTFAGTALVVRFAIIPAMIALLIWNYLNIA